jgi:site-specific recombinase XerD
MNEKAMCLLCEEDRMSVSTKTYEDGSSRDAGSKWLSTVSLVADDDIRVLMTDFFDWLEHAWQLPVLCPEHERDPLPQSLVLSQTLYTVEEIRCVYGLTEHDAQEVRCQHLIARGYRVERGRLVELYRKEDLGPLIARWEGKQVVKTLNEWWMRFFPAACQTGSHSFPVGSQAQSQQRVCKKAKLHSLHALVDHFVLEVMRLGSVHAWWHAHPANTWMGAQQSSWGILFVYLLDRRLLHLSNSELIQLAPLHTLKTQGLMRLWRSRFPQEYDQFSHALNMIISDKGTHRRVYFVLSVCVLLRYGLAGLSELSVCLSAEDLQQVCNDHCLVTSHLGHGIFLPYPLSMDIRVGHVVLDEIRFFCWQYAASQEQVSGTSRWNRGPQNVDVTVVNIIEKALAAPVYTEIGGIFSRRPETERSIVNPWRICHEGTLAQNGYTLQPPFVQQQLLLYLTYCHQEQGRTLGTISSRVGALMHFFTWACKQGKLGTYPHWDRERTHDIFRSYATNCGELRVGSRVKIFKTLAAFFTTLAELECPVPTGYHVLSGLEKGTPGLSRPLPREEVLDRVFHEGVCQLSYDPFARLALTIQYYCGTRITETCDLHLFCLLEDQEGHVSLLIPRGKTKQERPFPVVELGMGVLLRYMDEIVALRLAPDGNSRTLGKTNFRYLKDDPERAHDWHYLFDRVSDADGFVRRRGKLSGCRVGTALQEALLIAAKNNPEGLFQQESYSCMCRYHKKKGQKCGYFVAQQGMSICPCCGSPLSGERGKRCQHRFEEEFRCTGTTRVGEWFCPQCDMPLAKFVPITSHVFRHNSVSRAHRAGVALSSNMQLHGHRTIPMHLRYLHLFVDETSEEIDHIFAQKRVQEVHLARVSSTGLGVEMKNACPLSLEQYLSLTLQRSLQRRTYGIWGGFWAGALAQRGVASPLSVEEEMVIPEESYEHAVAQYWYEALGLAISEVAFESVTSGKWQAQVPGFLDREKIDALIQFHIHVLQDALGSVLGRRLIENDILEQRRFLSELAEKLHPWWHHLGTIEQLVELFAPGGNSVFQKRISTLDTLSLGPEELL